MRKGLGALQREILETLEDARHDRRGYRGFGGGSHWPVGHRWSLSGWVKVDGNTVRLGLTAYDLRASCMYLARKHDQADRARYASFNASFSRAVATLIKRGDLIPFERLLPIEDFEPDDLSHPDRIENLSDGKYLLLNDRRLRFVRRGWTATALMSSTDPDENS